MAEKMYLYDFYFDGDILEDEGISFQGVNTAEEAEVAALAHSYTLQGNHYVEGIYRGQEDLPLNPADEGYESKNAKNIILKGLEAAQKAKMDAMAFIERANRALEKME